jgi:lipopolysaccharide/colanic/teichoic acid biosynthesis glycosyltransferase
VETASARRDGGMPVALDEATFCRMIALERKRSERSQKPLLLMLLELDTPSSIEATCLSRILPALLKMTRETDIAGWYREDCVAGVLLTEVANANRNTIVNTMLKRVSAALGSELTPEQFNRVRIAFQWFPEEWDDEIPEGLNTPALYPELEKRARARKLFHILKRGMDIAGSTVALILASPLFLIFAAAIKLTSKGPIFFRQQRVGQYGKRFWLLKFRSMYDRNDEATHRDYVRQLIAGQAEKNSTDEEAEGVYKLINDSRVTRVGALLRRTSLDELPQFINVLKGEMSLVGPRPPIDYEVESYELWHRQRLLEAKPGITGLWQVNGRNRLGFDDMVRLDLRYARTWSPWLDLKIIFLTPKAMLEGAH